MTRTRTEEWRIEGAEGETIFGTAHIPEHTSPRATLLLGHGLKGFREYGFLPLLAQRLAELLPLAVHRFDFSHSGMGPGDRAVFERPDLFERDTWNRQAFDWRTLLRASQRGELPGSPADSPVVFAGHSRGGVSALLTAGRMFRDRASRPPSAIVTISTPASVCRWSDEQQREHIERGYTETPSARTGQTLRQGRAWLQEQIDDPDSHDLLALCARIACPVLAVHGREDTTAPSADAEAIASACRDGEAAVIAHADHVWNTPNPADPAAEHSAPLQELTGEIYSFLKRRGVDASAD